MTTLAAIISWFLRALPEAVGVVGEAAGWAVCWVARRLV